jgi:copper/silver efflux system protein
MPIKARIDMLSTGIRTPVGVKVYGTELAQMDKLARQIEAAIRTVSGTSSAFAERVIDGYYLNIDPDREQLARYGLMVGDVQNIIAMALGADPVTTTVEGRERYTVTIRYPRDFRSDPQAIASEVLIPIPHAATVIAHRATPCEETWKAAAIFYERFVRSSLAFDVGKKAIARK